MVEIDRKKERHIRWVIGFGKFHKKVSVWGVEVVYDFILAVGLAYVICGMSENWLTKFVSKHMVLSIFFICISALSIFLIYSIVSNMINRADIKFCSYVSGIEGVTAEEMIQIAAKYKLENMFSFALEKRLKELGITEVPPSCKDGWEVFRLPTKDDL